MTNGFGVNIAALKATRKLDESSRVQQTAMERLGSGMRINHASDDAAGLSIASSLRSDTRIYTQAIKNVNDGISAVSISTGALEQLTKIVTRQMELAEQSANGVYTARQRQALDKEANALVDEYNRIGSTVTFNGINLLTSTTNIQVGVGSESVLTVDAGSEIAEYIGTGEFVTQTTLDTGSATGREVRTSDLNGDGYEDIVTGNWTSNNISVMLSNGDGTFSGPTTYGLGGNASMVRLVDLNHDGKKDVVTRGFDGVNNSVAVLLGNGNGTFQSANFYSVGSTLFYDFELADFNNDGNLDFIGGHGSLGFGNGIGVYLGRSDGSFGSFTTVGAYRATEFSVGDFNGDSNLDFTFYDNGATTASIAYGNGTGSFAVSSLGYNSAVTALDANRDGYSDIVKYNNATTLGILLGSANNTFTSGGTIALTASSPFIVRNLDANSDGYSDLIAYSTTGTLANIIFGCGDGTFSAAQALTIQAGTNDVTVGDVTGNGAKDLIFGSTTTPNLTIYEQGGVKAVHQAHVNLLTAREARSALDNLDAQLNALSTQRAIIGAQEVRLTTINSVLENLRLNYTAAEGRIMDADVAQESAELIRSSINSQIASSVMSRSKNSQYLLLDLLK
jgi:flagellin-like hook-associated protein FlgL